MKYYEFVVIKDGYLYSSVSRKQDALYTAERLRNTYPNSEVSIKAHVYAKPLTAWDVGDYYLYSYEVK